MNYYSPPKLGPIFNDPLPGPNEFMASHPVRTILIGGHSPLDSQSNSQNNTMKNSPSSSPPIVHHHSVITIYFE